MGRLPLRGPVNIACGFVTVKCDILLRIRVLLGCFEGAKIK
nr:MAG TPA: hypothetical protein [Caudoviricetes sp.]